MYCCEHILTFCAKKVPIWHFLSRFAYGPTQETASYSGETKRIIRSHARIQRRNPHGHGLRPDYYVARSASFMHNYCYSSIEEFLIYARSTSSGNILKVRKNAISCYTSLWHSPQSCDKNINMWTLYRSSTRCLPRPSLGNGIGGGLTLTHELESS